MLILAACWEWLYFLKRPVLSPFNKHYCALSVLSPCQKRGDCKRNGGLNGMGAHEKWLEGMQLGLPLIPQLTAGVERLFWRMDPHSRTITTQGIAAFGMHYTGVTLHDALRIDMQGRKVHYHIRY